jgi:hypothetical protein
MVRLHSGELIMTPLTRIERIFFVIIFLSAVAIAIPGFFAPAGLASGLSWLELPPLHARFVAATYLFGALTMLGALLVREWTQVRTVLLLTAIFTGLLFVFSLLNLSAFDFSRPVVWLWFATYLSYPIVALILLTRRSQGGANGIMAAASLPAWIRNYLLVQGISVSLVAIVLLFFPGAIISAWPWQITARLAQFYSGPLLAYGVGSLIFGIRGTMRDMKVIAPAMLGFTASTLIVSIIHSYLFSFAELPDTLWFALFIIATLILVVINVQAMRNVVKMTYQAVNE